MINIFWNRNHFDDVCDFQNRRKFSTTYRWNQPIPFSSTLMRVVVCIWRDNSGTKRIIREKAYSNIDSFKRCLRILKSRWYFHPPIPLERSQNRFTKAEIRYSKGRNPINTGPKKVSKWGSSGTVKVTIRRSQPITTMGTYESRVHDHCLGSHCSLPIPASEPVGLNTGPLSASAGSFPIRFREGLGEV